MDWRTWKLADEERPSQLLHYWERPEYWEESRGLEETCCHSNSNEKPSANTDVKNSRGVNNNDNNNKGPKQRNCSKQLQTHNQPTVEKY